MDDVRAWGGVLVLVLCTVGCMESYAPIERVSSCRFDSPSGEFVVTVLRARTPTHVGDTALALRDAALRGYPHVEVDVLMSADGEMIPTHSDELELFSNCSGRVRDYTAAALASCEYLESPGTPLLPIWDGLGGVSFEGLYLDMKFTHPGNGEVDVDRAVQLVEDLDARLGRPRWLVAMSYDPEVAARLIDAGIRTGFKGYPEPADAMAFVEEAAAVGVELVCMQSRSLSPEVIARSQELGTWVLPWELGDDVTSELVVDLIDAEVGGLITDRVELARFVREQLCP
jgi:glycerophosphoryl diester phosphodiesterase